MKIGIFWFLLSLAGFITANVNARSSLCLDGESAIFNCNLERSVASLCLSSIKGSLVYRKGTPGKLELVLNEKHMVAGTVFLLSSVQFAGGYESHIRFSNAGVTYLLYDKSVKTSDGPDVSAGIIVHEKKRKSVNLTCGNNASIGAKAYETMQKEDYKLIKTE